MSNVYNPWFETARTQPALATPVLATEAVHSPPTPDDSDDAALWSFGAPVTDTTVPTDVGVPVRYTGRCGSRTSETYCTNHIQIALDQDATGLKCLFELSNIGRGPVRLASGRVDRTSRDVHIWVSSQILLGSGDRRARWDLHPRAEFAVAWVWCSEFPGPFALTVERAVG